VDDVEDREVDFDSDLEVVEHYCDD